MSGPLAYSARDQTEAAPCVEAGRAVIRKLSQGQSSGSNKEDECRIVVSDHELRRQVIEEVSV